MSMEEVLTEMKKTKYPQMVQVTNYVLSRPEGHCPVCGALVYKEWNNRFCGNCGQELDWSDFH